MKKWNDKIDRIQQVLLKWKDRDLSLFGKIQVIKTFTVSQCVLAASVLIVPPQISKKIENILYEFIWGSKDKVKRVKVIK